MNKNHLLQLLIEVARGQLTPEEEAALRAALALNAFRDAQRNATPEQKRALTPDASIGPRVHEGIVHQIREHARTCNNCASSAPTNPKPRCYVCSGPDTTASQWEPKP